MTGLTVDTFQRPEDISGADPAALYARSYLLIRTVLGVLGIVLPTALFIIDGTLLKGGVLLRGSISAYYHTSARDVLVGGLCIIGCLLMTYMAGQRQTFDFWLSSVAGAAVLGVALFPTGRPDLPEDAPRCGDLPIPPGCTALQQALGEDTVMHIHFICAAVFILSLAAIAFVFAHRAQKYDAPRVRVRLYRACGVAILAAIAWIYVGRAINVDLLSFSPLYVGEIVSVYAFALSWLVNGHDLWRSLFGSTPILGSGAVSESDGQNMIE
jgi:F0F1-type ATP synthase assembly protein I